MEKNLSDFNKDFFKKIEMEGNYEHDNFLNYCCKKYHIDDEQEKKSIIIYYYYNFYFDKLFSNLTNKKININKKDPRSSVLFRYCYKLQKETNGILDQKEYKDYVFCQLKFFKTYIEKTGKPVQIGPNILNIDKGWKKWKYFKYILNKKKYSDKVLPCINNDILESFLKKDRSFLENKFIINKVNIKDNIDKLILWNKVGSLSNYFMAFNQALINNKEFTAYRFDDKGKNLYRLIFPELI